MSFEKLIPVSGDISAENLGLSPTDKRMLTDRVTIVFHLAASIKFNDSLKFAILTNTRSTRDVCILAESMKNLVVRKEIIRHVYSQTTHAIHTDISHILCIIREIYVRVNYKSAPISFLMQ